MRIASALLLILFAALFAVMPAHAAEGYSNCTGTISSLPATISSSGTWCLKQNLSTAATSGSGITINADNAVLDCNDFQINGAGGTSIGIRSTNHFHDTVRHCNVQGFQKGLYFEITTAGPYGGHVVEDNHFEGNTLTGIHVQGDGSVVRRNLVFDTGSGAEATRVEGIATIGVVNISRNTVSFVNGIGGRDAYGINTIDDTGGSVDHNRVRQVVVDTQANIYDIYNTSTGYRSQVGAMTITDNDVSNGDTALNATGLPPVGIFCNQNVINSPLARASRNIIIGFNSGQDLSGCADGGQNDLSP